MEDRMPGITTLELSHSFGKYVVEPLERGYGNTLGNSLRRVLLSSIRGAAVTAIKIDKVLHEFQTIEGVKEDATELLLNLKSIAVKVLTNNKKSDDSYTLRLEVKGPGRVTAGDIQCPSDVEIVNPEAYLATISDEGAVLAMDLYVNQGQGYITPDKMEQHKNTIGVIPIGAQFTPVRKVNYTVEATRVGNRTDYERLLLEIWTNGTISPTDGMSQAAQILQRYVALFSNMAHGGLDMLGIGDEDEIDPMLASVPDTKIEELDFSQRTFNCLRRASLLSLRDLVQVSENDLINIRGFGRKSLQEVREKLESLGLSLKPPKDGVTIDLSRFGSDSDFDD